MIEYRIGYIGKEDDEVYKRAQEYFKEKNLGDDDFHIVIENITGMSFEEIDAKTFHTVFFDSNILDTEMSDVFQDLKNSRTDIADISFLPFARETITRDEAFETSSKLNKIFETDEIKTVPINVSEQIDIEGYLDSLYISSIQYKDIVNGIIQDREEIRNRLVDAITTALQKKDSNNVTYDHVASVGKMTEEFARYLGFDEEFVSSMKYSAMTHDTGKIAIPDRVLNAGVTVKKEIQEMNPHDELGGIILNNKKLISEEEKKGIVGHHGKERVNNDYSNIITIVDSFDAMTSQRGYNCPKNILAALEEVMKCSEPNIRNYTQFKDKELCKQFVLFNAIELGKMGYNVQAMFQDVLSEKKAINERAQKSTDDDWKFAASAGLKAVEEVLGICKENSDKIKIDDPPTKAVTALGYALDENGRLDYIDKTLKHDYNTRLNSEFEFQVKKLFNDEKNPEYFAIFKNAQNIDELIKIYLEKEEVSTKEESRIWGKAQAITKSEDEKGQKRMQIGRETRENYENSNEDNKTEVGMHNIKINLAEQIPNAAKKDSKDYNLENSKQAIETIRTEVVKQQSQDKNQTQTQVQNQDQDSR